MFVPVVTAAGLMATLCPLAHRDTDLSHLNNNFVAHETALEMQDPGNDGEGVGNCSHGCKFVGQWGTEITYEGSATNCNEAGTHVHQ